MQAQIVEMLPLVFNPPQDLLSRTRIQDRSEQILPGLCDVSVSHAEGLEQLKNLSSGSE